MRRIGYLVTIGLAAVLVASGHAAAQETGHAAAGRRLAQQICSQCHATERTQRASPDEGAPRFETIANVPGMTSAALSVALQRSHELMPNVMLKPDELADIVAYILSLQRAD